MFAKLLKYDIKKTIKFFLVLYGLALLAACLARLCSYSSNTFISIIGNISESFVWVILINAFVNHIMRLISYFRRDLYGDESYLLHTLPVKTSTIYWSKFAAAFIILVLNFLVSAVAIKITYTGTAFADFLNSIIPEFSSVLGLSTPGLVWLLVAILFVEILNFIVVGFLGHILGFRKNNNTKLGWSILYIFAIYIAVSIFIVLVVLLAGLINPDILKIFTEAENNINPAVFTPTIIACLCGYVIAIFTITLASARTLNRGVNVL